MLKFDTPGGTGEVENCWGELNPVQFAAAVEITNRFLRIEFDLDEYRLRLLEMLTGYKRKKKRSKFAGQINENLYLISEQLTFTVLPVVGPPEVLEFFSPELRALLKTKFPWEIYEPHLVSQLIQVKDLLQVEYALNFDLTRNLLPQVRNGKAVLQGPVFNTADGDIDTNLKAGQYLDALEYFNAWSNGRNPKYLDAFIGCLYKYIPQGSEILPPEKGESQPTAGEGVIPDLSLKKTKDALIMVFLYIQQTFVNDPIFGILFTGNSSSTGKKLSLGNSEAIYQVVEAGYGSQKEVSEMNIRDFFNIQIRIIKNNVAILRGQKKNSAEISKELNLPLEIVQNI